MQRYPALVEGFYGPTMSIKDSTYMEEIFMGTSHRIDQVFYPTMPFTTNGNLLERRKCLSTLFHGEGALESQSLGKDIYWVGG